MPAIVTVALGACISALAEGSKIEWQTTPMGATAMVTMKHAPFPHASRENGFKNKDKTFPRSPHYVDSTVALFVPRDYRLNGRVHLLVYLHGHSSNVRRALERHKLREQIVASGRNVILVFPEGPKDAADSGCGKLEDAGGLKRLVDEAVGILHREGKILAPNFGRVLIAGHSGAYRGISFCVEHGGLDQHLSDVCLLDASYGRLDAFVHWTARDNNGTFFSIFTDHLASENVYLMTNLRERKIPCLLAAEQSVDIKTLKQNRVVFLHAEKLTHDATVGWLERWLKSRADF